MSKLKLKLLQNQNFTGRNIPNMPGLLEKFDSEIDRQLILCDGITFWKDFETDVVAITNYHCAISNQISLESNIDQKMKDDQMPLFESPTFLADHPTTDFEDYIQFNVTNTCDANSSYADLELFKRHCEYVIALMSKNDNSVVENNFLTEDNFKLIQLCKKLLKYEILYQYDNGINDLIIETAVEEISKPGSGDHSMKKSHVINLMTAIKGSLESEFIRIEIYNRNEDGYDDNNVNLCQEIRNDLQMIENLF